MRKIRQVVSKSDSNQRAYIDEDKFTHWEGESYGSEWDPIDWFPHYTHAPTLYRSSEGRWFLVVSTVHFDFGDTGIDTFEEIDDAQAVNWLLANGHEVPEDLAGHAASQMIDAVSARVSQAGAQQPNKTDVELVLEDGYFDKRFYFSFTGAERWGHRDDFGGDELVKAANGQWFLIEQKGENPCCYHIDQDRAFEWFDRRGLPRPVFTLDPQPVNGDNTGASQNIETDSEYVLANGYADENPNELVLDAEKFSLNSANGEKVLELGNTDLFRFLATLMHKKNAWVPHLELLEALGKDSLSKDSLKAIKRRLVELLSENDLTWLATRIKATKGHYGLFNDRATKM